MSRAEVSAMSSTACRARTPDGSDALKACSPCLNLLQKASLVFYIIVEFQEYDQHAVLALGVGLLLVYLLVSEDEILQRFRYPFFHLIGCGTGIYGNAGALADGELRHFLLRHDADAQNAHENEHTHEEHHDIMVAHRRFDERTLDDAVGFSVIRALIWS